MTKKVSLLSGPTMNNRTMLNRTMLPSDALSAVKKQSDDIPTLLGTSVSTSNLAANFIQEEPTYLNPEEYFRQVLDPKLLCFKCKQLYTDPIACYKCGKVYCFNCLEWELNSHSRCLYCFNIVFKEIAERVNEDIMLEYDRNEVKCPYHKCKEVKKLRYIRDHVTECLYRDDKNDINRLEHIDKVVCFNNDNDIYVQNHLLAYFKKQYEEMQLEQINQGKTGKTMNKTLNLTQGSKKSIYIPDVYATRYSRFSIANTKDVNKSSPRKKIYNYNSFLDDNEFIPKHKELKTLIDNTNEHIGRIVYELANKTKESNEKIKKLINNK